MFRILKDISLLLLVFGTINDDFVVDRVAGENALKIIFVLFLAFHAKDIFIDFFRPKNGVMKSFYIFLFVLSSIVFINVIMQSITFDKALLILIPIVTVFVFVSYYKEFEKLLYFIWFSVIVSAIISVFSDPLTPWTFRKTGGTGDPNEFAVHLLAAMTITVYLFYKNRNHLFFWPSQALFLYALLYAGSKSSFLTLAILILYAVVVRFSFLIKKLFSFRALVLSIVIIVGLFSANVFEMTAVKGMQERAKSSGTAKTRFVSWNAGFRMSQQNFFTGVGVEQYEKYARAYATDYIAEGSLAPHNFLVKLIGENGIFPFIAMLVFLFMLFTAEYRRVIKSDYFWIHLAALSTVFMGLTLSMTYEKYFWLFLGLLSHVLLVLWAEEDEREEEGVKTYEDNAYLT